MANGSSQNSRPNKTITQLLLKWSDGDDEALAALMPLIYDELHRLASSCLRRERTSHTLQTEGLLHEAYLRLVAQPRFHWSSRAHFYAIAAQMMRRILVDYARRHRAAKRGGSARKLSLEQVPELQWKPQPDYVLLDEALKELAAVDPQLCKVVELRYFGGLAYEKIAEVLDISSPTVYRRWRMARAWLYRYLSDGHI